MTYVSELQIQENVVIRRERLLIFPGKVSASVGQEVQPDTILAKTELLPGVPVAIDLAGYFGIDPSEVALTLLKQVGDSIEVGERLAVRQYGSLLEGGRSSYISPFKGVVEHISSSRGLVMIREEASEDEPVAVVEVARELNISPRFLRTFAHVRVGDEVNYGSILASTDGFGKEGVRSPIRGIVAAIDTQSGTISLIKPYSPSYARAYLAGTVVEVVPERGAIVETTGTYLEGVFGIGGERFGTLMQAAAEQGEDLDATHFGPQHYGAVVFGGAGITLEGMKAALQHDVAGVIVGGLSSQALVSLLGREFSVGITGHEDLSTTFIATEGFGSVPMLEKTYGILQRRLGSLVSMNGRTQIRAGVQRPEIIINHQIPAAARQAAGQPRGAMQAPARLGVGSQVRVIIDPYFGQTGEIVAELPKKKLPTEVEAPLLQVQLADGQLVELLANNVESMRR